MNMNAYEAPIIEVVTLCAQDVVKTSGGLPLLPGEEEI